MPMIVQSTRQASRLGRTPRSRSWVWLALSVVLVLAAPALLPAADRGWLAKREQLRQQRAEIQRQAADDRLRRAANAHKHLVELIASAARARQPGQDVLLRRQASVIGRLDPSLSPDLEAAIAALPSEPEAPDRRSQREWTRALDRYWPRLLERHQLLLNRAVELQVNDLAYEFLQEILAFDPDREPLRRQLGQTRVGDQWLSGHSLVMARQGFTWSTQWGWYRPADHARYEAGEIFDLQSGRWVALAEAERLRSSPANAWEIRTDNLLVSGTAPLATLVEAATRLEAFHAQIFAAYAAFFTRGASDYRLILGISEHDPLRVQVLRDKDQYLLVSQGPEWSAGLYKSSTKTSYFFGRVSSVMYHEFTHQILHEFTGRNRSPTWLTEAIAQYTETPVYEDGRLVLGRLSAAGDVRRWLSDHAAGRAMGLEALMAITTGEQWRTAADVTPQYRAAAAVGYFGMEAENRRFRADFIDFTRDSYRGEAAGEIWDYLGLTRAAFHEAFATWATETRNAARPR